MTLRPGVPFPVLALLLGLLAVFAQPALASPATGTIVGEVFDTEGDGVAGAAIAITQGTAMVRSGTTTAGGAFTVRNVPAGTYTVIVSHAKYERETRPDVVVQEGQTVSLVLTLTSLAPKAPVVAAKPSTRIDFDDLDVDGELVKPSGALTLDRKTATYNPLIRLGPYDSANTVTAAYTAPESTEGYATIDESTFHTVADAPLSTFAADVDTASYANVRRFLQDGQAPPRDAVRIEELVNYFPYEDAHPLGDAPFAATAEVKIRRAHV